jgi:hypothetical protein
MIIKIDSSILHATNANSKNPDIIEAFKDLMHSRCNGNISVEGDKSVYLNLISKISNPDIINFLRHEKNQITFNKEFLDNFSFKLLLIHSDHEVIINNEQFLIFDIKGYVENKYKDDFKSPFERPKLVTENSTSDGRIFKKICELEFSKTMNKDFHIKLEKINGGGHTTSEVIEHTDANPLIIFAIVDCDKKHPSDKIGETSRKVKRHFEAKNLFFNFKIINMHELENLFPLSWFELKGNNSQATDIKKLINLSAKYEEAMFYYDFKKSFGYKSIFVETQTPLSVYWKPKFEEILTAEYIENKKIEFQTLQASTGNRDKDIKLLGKLGTVFNIISTCFLKEELSCFEQPTLEVQWKIISMWMIERFIASRPHQI